MITEVMKIIKNFYPQETCWIDFNNGLDTNPGTYDKPIKTLDKALVLKRKYDVIKKGHYDITLNLLKTVDSSKIWYCENGTHISTVQGIHRKVHFGQFINATIDTVYIKSDLYGNTVSADFKNCHIKYLNGDASNAKVTINIDSCLVDKITTTYMNLTRTNTIFQNSSNVFKYDEVNGNLDTNDTTLNFLNPFDVHPLIKEKGTIGTNGIRQHIGPLGGNYSTLKMVNNLIHEGRGSFEFNPNTNILDLNLDITIDILPENCNSVNQSILAEKKDGTIVNLNLDKEIPITLENRTKDFILE